MTDPQNRTIENTYLLEPKEDERFFPNKVKAVIDKIFNEKLKNKVFDKLEAHQFVGELTSELRRRIATGYFITFFILIALFQIIKEIRMPRYKTVIQVVYGPLEQQSIRVTSKCLWDPNYDNFTSSSFQNESIYCVAMVFGCYYE